MEEAERTPGPSSHSHVYSTSSTAPSAGHSAALLVKGTAGYTMFAFRGRRESLSSCPEAAITQCLVFSSSGRISPPNWPLSSAGFRKYPRACHYFCIAEPKGPPCRMDPAQGASIASAPHNPGSYQYSACDKSQCSIPSY
ncbi:Hypothetical predicted protein [Pelobates cultripes]|uniref:Uncharacterized protein n=1 Tax=Pelobates cultripes TaxID=61616 RepID=A0AAD1WGV7_PELCU|nr:Hypothetical predicted protein [Pelobates cultripes]